MFIVGVGDAPAETSQAFAVDVMFESVMERVFEGGRSKMELTLVVIVAMTFSSVTLVN